MKTYKEETKLIEKLEASRPKWVERSLENKWQGNPDYWVHEQKIRDAYWRRRRIDQKKVEKS